MALYLRFGKAMHRSSVIMAWNVFKLCTTLGGIGSVMILVVIRVIGVMYYAVVILIFGPLLSNGSLNSLHTFTILVVFCFLLVMLFWSYFSLVLMDPDGIPPNLKPAVDEERVEATPLMLEEVGGSQPRASVQAAANSKVRYCRKCNELKHPHCHHRYVCGRCVLKIDHHYVWVVSCVSAMNYRYFLKAGCFHRHIFWDQLLYHLSFSHVGYRCHN